MSRHGAKPLAWPRMSATALLMAACAVGVFGLAIWLHDSNGTIRALWGAAAIALMTVVPLFGAMLIWRDWRR